MLFEEEEKGPLWVATYHLGYSEFDDDMDSQETEEVTFNAEDFETAVRYTQQYLRKMKTEEETAETWKDAEILSVEMY